MPSTRYGVSQDVHASGSSSAHSKLAVASFEENSNVAVESGLGETGPDSSVVSGTTSDVAAATANGDSMSVTPHAMPAIVLTVTSVHSVPLWCSTRAGSGVYAASLYGTQTVTGAPYSAVVETS